MKEVPFLNDWVIVKGKSLYEKMSQTLLFNKLKQLQVGSLHVIDGKEKYSFGSEDKDSQLECSIYVENPNFYPKIVFGGGIGAGEAYMEGYFRCSDLAQLTQIALLNRAFLSNLESGLAKLSAPIFKAMHFLRMNTLQGSQKNIQAHYDLGNKFFKYFLDKTLMYSSAVFKNSQTSLEEASIYKIDQICQKLHLKAGDKILEIGTGWGSFAIHAAQKYGCHVTTTTLSNKQYRYTAKKIKELGLQKQITLLKKDYRNLTGSYDKLVSIEMIEAVGHHYFKTFFKKCNELLKPDGLFFLQSIVIPDQEYDRYKDSVDFIRHYIFPGGCLPSLKVIEDCISEATDFRLYELKDISQDYAKTLSIWRKRLLKNWNTIKKLGYSEKFLRMWEFYFATCEGGFRVNHIRDVQAIFSKPMTRF